MGFFPFKISFKWILLVTIVIIILILLRRTLHKKGGILEHANLELSRLDKDQWMNFLIPGYEFDEKVRAYNKLKKPKKLKHKKVKVRPSKKSTNKHEERVREVLENYFDDNFPTCRPKFLKNPKTGRCLELDGYNAGLNLAFEYQGIQHRKYTPKFHKSEEDFRKQQYRDKVKKEILKSLEIDLLEVPDYIKYDNLENFVHEWLKIKNKHRQKNQ